MDIVFLLQIAGILLTAATPVLFGAPRIPYIKRYVRPVSFEEGWYSLVVTGNLNYRERGYDEVLQFIIGHSIEEGHFADQVAEDLEIEPENIISDTNTPAVEEIRIQSKPPDWREQILLCYDEDTEGPAGQPKVTSNHGFEIPNTDSAGDDWRWFGVLSGAEDNAQRLTRESIDRWTSYGAISLAFGVIFNLLAIGIQI